ncbi:CGNR zinc finger domain-containing protein [Umezawaea tangerina]|uniref:Putative RNA-binding Zn ribbon-like protein n=1 Tax=Umezawaea tangerina TaxID=84725 RepID=A0A2T0TG82_9PSEU|nr:ABATE domain-containing protein [Umezawaea tangerina]PRY44633.1 putative RNA-binding Zn ribbon-like protein [Umezawaea tangerina]
MRHERVCLELVGTVRGRLGEPSDDLADPVSLAGWLARRGLRPTEEPDAAHVTGFRALREASYRLLVAVTGGGAPRPDDVALVNRRAAHPAPAVSLVDTPGGGLRREVAVPTPEQALAVVARDLVDLVGGPDLVRLHQCEADVCGTFFVDTSRAGSRRWCSSATCGNRARVAAHRGRAAQP